MESQLRNNALGFALCSNNPIFILYYYLLDPVTLDDHVTYIKLQSYYKKFKNNLIDSIYWIIGYDLNFRVDFNFYDNVT